MLAEKVHGLDELFFISLPNSKRCFNGRLNPRADVMDVIMQPLHSYLMLMLHRPAGTADKSRPTGVTDTRLNNYPYYNCQTKGAIATVTIPTNSVSGAPK